MQDREEIFTKIRKEFDEKGNELNNVTNTNPQSTSTQLLEKYQRGWKNMGFICSGPEVTEQLEEFQGVSNSMMTSYFLQCRFWNSHMKNVGNMLSRDGINQKSLEKLRMKSGEQGICDFVEQLAGEAYRNDLRGCPTQADIDLARKVCEDEANEFKRMSPNNQ